jgi:hypothetical protein
MSDSKLPHRKSTVLGNGLSLKKRLARIAAVGMVLIVALFAVTAIVGAKGLAIFNVDEGRVEVSGAGKEVLLKAGQSTTASDGEAPEPLVTEDCTYGQGFWKNHSTDWPVDTLTLGGVSYDQSELLAILGTSPRGDATYILARQLIAAKLSILAGADSTAADTAIAAADAWLALYPPDSDPTEPDRQDGIVLAETLDDYNSGVIGPGSCDEEEPEDTTAMTSTVTMSPTVTMTPTVTISATAVITDCTGANPHPHATTLADRYDVTYDDIMGWKCSGFGFGEVEHAYSLSTTKTISEIFDLRDQGYGWGQIKKMQLDGELDEDGLIGTNLDKIARDNPLGKKDKADLGPGVKNNANHGNGKADLGQDHGGQGNNGQGRSGQAVNGQGDKDKSNNGKADLGHGDGGQGNRGQGNNGHSNNSGGKKDK